MKTFVIYLALALALIATANAATDKILCYYGSWATYRKNEGKVTVKDLDPKICTHIIYSFTGINTKGEVVLLDKDLDQKALPEFAKLKQKNSKVKLMIAIGGWSEGSEKFSKVAANNELRKKFAENVVKFLSQYKLDGLDVDWEYPAQRGGSKDDRRNFIELLKELRKHFAKKYVLTAAVGAMSDLLKTSYDAKNMNKYLDYINLMTYDVHSSSDGVAGFNAPLASVRKSVDAWIKAGASPEKLILGLGFYGKSFQLSSASNNSPGAKTSGPGEKGKFNEESGNLSYLEICLNIKKNKWSDKWDSKEKVPYAYHNNQWVGYDNAKSLDIKVGYAKSKKLGGVMMWSIEQDDVHNACGGGKYALLKSLKKSIQKKD